MVNYVNLVSTILFFPAYRRPSGRSPEDGVTDDDDDDDSHATSTIDPRSGSITERSNSSKNDKSQILYLITSSPKKSENEMPGQWLGRGRTAAHSSSMYIPIPRAIHSNAIFTACYDVTFK